MSRKKSKATKKATCLGAGACTPITPRADFTKNLDQGYEDTFYGQKGTVKGVTEEVVHLIADGTEDSALRSSAPTPEWYSNPTHQGAITLLVGVLLSVFLICAIFAPIPAA